MRTLSIVLLAGTLAGCGLDNFDVELDEEATVPGDPAANAVLDVLPFGTQFENIDLLADQELRDEGVDAGDIDSAKIESMRLEVLDGASFEDWLDDVAFYVEAEGLERKLVAEKHDVRAMPAGTGVLELDVTRVELKPYVSKPLTIVAEVAGRPPVEDTRIRATIVVGIDADVSNFLGL